MSDPDPGSEWDGEEYSGDGQRLDELESRVDELEDSGTPGWGVGYGLGSLVAAILSGT